MGALLNFVRYITAILQLVAGLLLAGCSGGTSVDVLEISGLPKPIRLSLPAGTPEQTRAILRSTISNTVDECSRRLSLSFENSEIASVNSAGHTIRIPVSRDTYNLLLLAQEYHRKTSGAFDITTSPIACLWGFHGSPVPARDISDDVLRTALKSVGHDKLRLHKNTVELLSPYTRLNLDELLCAYAVDLSILKIRRMEYSRVMLDIQGSARALGNPGRKSEWTYPLMNPFNHREQLAAISLNNLPALAIVESGSPTVTINGKCYGPIIDPRTGRPAEGTALALVLAPTATKAFALAQALFILGAEEGRNILSEFQDCEVLLIPDAAPHQMLVTQGIAALMETPEPPVMPRVLLENATPTQPAH